MIKVDISFMQWAREWPYQFIQGNIGKWPRWKDEKTAKKV